MQLPITGSCQCADVTYSANEAPVLTLACHCKDCQKLSATAYSVTVLFREEAFSIEGELRAYESFADSGKRKIGYFCPRCGSRIYNLDPDAPKLVRLKPGTLDNTEIPEPQAHVWTSRKQPWVKIPAGTPTFDENASNLGRLMKRPG
ncbi:MAG: hypothetical protein ACI9W2_003277 [Gammaproteobacteria bacterium]|jgi:hypothetical protein